LSVAKFNMVFLRLGVEVFSRVLTKFQY